MPASQQAGVTEKKATQGSPGGPTIALQYADGGAGAMRARIPSGKNWRRNFAVADSRGSGHRVQRRDDEGHRLRLAIDECRLHSCGR